MNIQDAIKQAGEGGKIRRGDWSLEVPNLIIPSYSNGNLEYESEWEGGQYLSTDNITTTKWEVVAPEIEVEKGDIFKGANCDNGVCEIVGIGSSEYALERIDNGRPCVCSIFKSAIDTEKLIRKGNNKHVFEGVCISYEGRKMEIEADEWISGLDKKTYRMTLEEAE